MVLKHWLAGALAAAALTGCDAQRSQPAEASPRIYVFENGTINGLDPALFNFRREELQAGRFREHGVSDRAPPRHVDVRCGRRSG